MIASSGCCVVDSLPFVSLEDIDYSLNIDAIGFEEHEGVAIQSFSGWLEAVPIFFIFLAILDHTFREITSLLSCTINPTASAM